MAIVQTSHNICIKQINSSTMRSQKGIGKNTFWHTFWFNTHLHYGWNIKLDAHCSLFLLEIDWLPFHLEHKQRFVCNLCKIQHLYMTGINVVWQFVIFFHLQTDPGLVIWKHAWGYTIPVLRVDGMTRHITIHYNTSDILVYHLYHITSGIHVLVYNLEPSCAKAPSDILVYTKISK